MKIKYTIEYEVELTDEDLKKFGISELPYIKHLSISEIEKRYEDNDVRIISNKYVCTLSGSSTKIPS